LGLSGIFCIREAMNVVYINSRIQIPLSELHFRFTRSGGPGGQNVNRVSTRVELVFDMQHSPSLDPASREMLRSGLRSKLDSRGTLRVVSQESRSQWKNKQTAIEKFEYILRRALRPAKHRTPSTATRSSKEKRLTEKKQRGESKKLRQFDSGSEFS
jgi:ribosome-associated protein